jgi:hypothetical protein
MASLESFFDDAPVWGTSIEVERRNRIKIAVAAYAYEIADSSIISDGEYDSLALKINPKMATIETYMDKKAKARYNKLDKFFSEVFSPDTGQWIYKHPELDLVRQTYERYYRK